MASNNSDDASSFAEAERTPPLSTSATPNQQQQEVRQRRVAANNPKPKAKQPSQQQRMLQQMKAQQDLERQQDQVVRSVTGGAFSHQLVKLMRTVVLIVAAGGILLYLYNPRFLRKVLRWRHKPELPPRSLISAYPDNVRIRRDLPRFYHEYSLATPENRPAREAIRHIATLRQMATNEGSKYTQKIMLWPWEHEQFRRQLPNRERLDEYCGKNADELWEQRVELREELLLWCLIATGHDHGFVRYQVQEVYGSLARGIKGVAVQYDGHPDRIMARSILLLPFHAPEALKEGKTLPPSTKVAMRTLSWLRQNAPLIDDVDELVAGMEVFLHWAIHKEDASAWHLMYAACTAAERQARHGDPRVASMCAHGEEEKGVDCCVIYDPKMHEFYGRAKPAKRVKASLQEDTRTAEK